MNTRRGHKKGREKKKEENARRYTEGDAAVGYLARRTNRRVLDVLRAESGLDLWDLCLRQHVRGRRLRLLIGP